MESIIQSYQPELSHERTITYLSSRHYTIIRFSSISTNQFKIGTAAQITFHKCHKHVGVSRIIAALSMYNN